MELRARTRPTLRHVVMTAAVATLLVPAAAGQAQAKTHRSKLPVVTSVAPMKLRVGEKLTIRGRNFVRGKGKDSVVFKRDGAKAIFVKADLATAKLIKVTVPTKLASALVVRDGAAVHTRFRIRVLAKKLGKAYTARKRSPLIGPVAPPAPARPPAAAPDQDCDGDGATNRADADDDNDLLADALEARIATDACKADTDGDGITDGYEYQSARDLNDDDYQDPNRYLPYPGKRPYPNPLYKGDEGTDFDGDGLTLTDEYRLWQHTLTAERHPADLGRLSYSDGRQYSVGAFGSDGRWRGSLAALGYDKQGEFLAWAATSPALDSGAGGYATVWIPLASSWFDLRDSDLRNGVDSAPRSGYLHNELTYYDFDSDLLLSDDERDQDADGLTNWDESHGRMLSSYWSGCYAGERAYPIAYAGTDLVDADTDGDGVRDGADDQDHDDVPNMMELSRNMASGLSDWGPAGRCDPKGLPTPPATLHPWSRRSGTYGRVNPYNPCLPDELSRTCLRHPELNNGSAPFDGSLNWAALN